MRIYVVVLLTLSCGVASAEASTSPNGYERAVENVPPRHWSLVREVIVEHRETGQANKRTFTIRLPEDVNEDDLYHEVGHIVAWSNPEIEHEWAVRFWPNGRITGIPVNQHAMSDPSEDFAETYEWILSGKPVRDAKRLNFMQERVFSKPAPTTSTTPTPSTPTTRVSKCVRPDVPSGSIVPGCAG